MLSKLQHTDPTTTESHVPVMVHEIIQHLNLKNDGYYIDATFGRGGHTKAILQHLGTDGRVLALDRDPDAIAAGYKLAQTDLRFKLIHAEFSQLKTVVKQYNWMGKIKGIIFDLGVSSPQLNTSKRGFSFIQDGPLDMRMNPQNTTITAASWLAQASSQEITQVLRQFGEERYAKRIAQAIVNIRHQQPIQTTGQLASIIKAANPAWEWDKHPATRSFQAIRIHINQELEELKLGLEAALDILSIGGRLLVLSFHSLEDRIVKRFFRNKTRGDNLPRNIPIQAAAPQLQLPVSLLRPSMTEIKMNPRSRSAILRVAEKNL